MKNITNCQKCNSENIYQDGILWICPECSHEWSELSESKPSSKIEGLGSINLKSEFVLKA